MPAASRIALDAETLLSHVAKLNAATDAIPAGSRVRGSVQGNQGVDAERVFHAWLTASAGRLADAGDSLRRDLTQNTGAMKHTAETLLHRDRRSADEAQGIRSTLSTPAATSGGRAVAADAAAPLDARRSTPTPS